MSEGAEEMTFIEHLEELRWHLFRAAVSVFVFTTIIFLLKPFIFDTVIFGPTSENFLTYRGLCWLSNVLSLQGALCLSAPTFPVQNFEVMGQFLTHIKVSIVGGLIISFPYILWEAWKFISPGLYEREIRTTQGIVLTCSVLFLLGVAFGYFVLFPFSVKFLTNYSVSEQIGNNITLTSYISFITTLTLAAGIMFELPIIIYFLSKLGVVSSEWLGSHRRHALVFILLVSAIITPPDVMSQFLLGIPVMALYEVGIWIARRVEKKREAEFGEA